MPDLDTWVLTSADGTAVEYLSVGRGPHVIVVTGALAMASGLDAFATLLAELDTWVLTSADGTAVEYLSVGRGPHVIVVPGALAMASDLAAFATLLAERHTVHVVQRRGRGGSG